MLYIIRGTYLESEATFFRPKAGWRVAFSSTVNSGASMHMMSKTELSPEKLETVTASRLPVTVITANGSVGATEGQTPNLINGGKIALCKCDNFMLVVVPGLSSDATVPG